MKYLFSTAESDEAVKFQETNGFVAFSNLLSPSEIAELTSAVDEATSVGRLTVGDEEMPNNNDCVFAHPVIEAMVRNPQLVAMARRLIGHPIELQHSRFNAKPLHDKGSGEVKWHQDYPFYPHTNFDMVSCLIHLDDEAMDAGPLKCVPGSHKWSAASR